MASKDKGKPVRAAKPGGAGKAGKAGPGKAGKPEARKGAKAGKAGKASTSRGADTGGAGTAPGGRRGRGRAKGAGEPEELQVAVLTIPGPPKAGLVDRLAVLVMMAFMLTLAVPHVAWS